MNLPAKRQLVLLASIALLSGLSTTAQAAKAMPPTFSFANKPKEVLSEYPLGSISKQDAFSHHGGPLRKLSLPNGNKGWLYSVGEEAGVAEIYILQFSGEDVVIDVMHRSLQHENGHTALQYQFLRKIKPQLNMRGPGPGE